MPSPPSHRTTASASSARRAFTGASGVVAVAVAITAAMLCLPAMAMAEPDRALELGARAGLTYDSNVTVSATDTATGQSDSAAELGASASYKFIKTPTQSLSLGYDFSQSLHETLNQFDLQTHAITLNGSQALGAGTAGLLYSYNHVNLGGRPFIDLNFINPSYMAPVTKAIFVRSSIVYINDSFHTDTSRNADHVQPDVQVFYFFPGAKSFISVDANYQHEQTKGKEFTYSGYGLRADLSMPVKIFSTTAKLKAGYEWVNRDYDNITPSIGARRFDRLGTARLSSELPLTEHLNLEVQGQYIGRSSNLASANLDETVVGTAISYHY